MVKTGVRYFGEFETPLKPRIPAGKISRHDFVDCSRPE